MAPAPNPGPSATTLVAGLAAIGFWRLSAVAAPHMAALAIMLQTEAGFGGRMGFALAWGILNFFFISLLRRPALSGALSLTLVVLLVLLSRLKHDVVQMTANFVDLMVIDRDTAAYLFTIFPNLRWSVVGAALVILPLMYALWWLDPFRIRRLPAAAGLLACLAALTGQAMTWPDEAWSGYYDDGYLSKFARSGVTAISDFANYGFMESEAVTAERLKVPLEDSCHVAGRRPHIIMIHDELSFDIRQANGVKVPPGYGSHFKSFDGRERKFMAESSGGASWMAEYNVLAGPVVALVRPLLLFRHPHRLRAGRARVAAGAAPLRLQHAVALSGLRRLHGRARLPDLHRHAALLRRARSRRQGHRAGQLLLRQGRQADRRAAGQYAAVHLRLPRRQPFPLGNQIPPRPAAVLAQARQRAGGRRISAPPDHERRRLCRLRRQPEEEVPGAAVPDRPLWRPSAGVLVEPAGSRPG